MHRLKIFLFLFLILSGSGIFAQRLQHDWENYILSIKEKPVSVNVDLGIRPFVPLNDSPFVVIVRVKLEQTNELGMPSQEEVDVLNDLEDNMVDKLSRAHGALYVGRFTQRGLREFYFYANDTIQYNQTLVDVFGSFQSYAWLAQSKKDEAWQNYLTVLYPSDIDLFLINSRKQLESFLKKNPISTKKSVSHFFEFSDDSSCKKFLQSPVCSKYTVNQYSKKSGSKGITLMFAAVESIDRKWLDATIRVLFMESKKHGGLYKGWEID